MTKHSDAIWRTVVFAGAMLGAPLVSADAPQKPQPSKPAPDQEAKPKPPAPPKDSVDSVTKQIAELDKQIAAATELVKAAQSEADRKAAKAKLDQLAKTRAELSAKLAVLKKAAAPQTPLQKLEQELADNQAAIDTTTDAAAASQSAADRAAAKAHLVALLKERAEIESKIAAEKQKLARPRADKDRPVGRGFVLS